MATDSKLSLGLGFVGAALGSYFGPGGAALGFSIGSGVGSALTPAEPIEAARISDLTVTGANYGDPISRCYGTITTPGNMLWSSGIIIKKQKKNERGRDF